MNVWRVYFIATVCWPCSYPVGDQLMNDVQHFPGLREHQTAMSFPLHLVQQVHDDYQFPRLLDQDVVRHVFDLIGCTLITLLWLQGWVVQTINTWIKWTQSDKNQKFISISYFNTVFKLKSLLHIHFMLFIKHQVQVKHLSIANITQFVVTSTCIWALGNKYIFIETLSCKTISLYHLSNVP